MTMRPHGVMVRFVGVVLGRDFREAEAEADRFEAEADRFEAKIDVYTVCILRRY